MSWTNQNAYGNFTLDELKSLYQRRFPLGSLPLQIDLVTGLLVGALIGQDTELGRADPNYYPLTDPTTINNYIQSRIQVPEQNQTQASQNVPRTPHPPGGIFQQLYQLPVPWQSLWDQFPFNIRNAHYWAVVAEGTRNFHDNETIVAFMEQLRSKGTPMNDILNPGDQPAPLNPNPSGDVWTQDINQFVSLLTNVVKDPQMTNYLNRLTSYWRLTWNTAVTPALFLSGFRDAMRNRLAYEDALRFYGKNSDMPYQPSGLDLLGIVIPHEWMKFFAFNYTFSDDGSQVFSHLLENLHLTPAQYISRNGPGQGRVVGLAPSNELDVHRLYHTVYNPEADAAAITPSTGEASCSLFFNSLSKPRQFFQDHVANDKNFGWWGNFIDDGLQKPRETNLQYRQRLYCARDNMRLQLRARPYMPPPATIGRSGPLGRTEVGRRGHIKDKLSLLCSKREAVHRAKMDPNHEGYDAQYRSDFQSAASRAYADNMARRQAAWAYRNSEMRRLTQAANLEYPGDVIPTAPPVNLDDLYEDNELRDEDEGGEDAGDDQDEQNVVRAKKKNPLTVAKCERCRKQRRARCDIETRQPCSNCAIVKVEEIRNACKLFKGTISDGKLAKGGTGGPYLISQWARHLPVPPNRRSIRDITYDSIPTLRQEGIYDVPFKEREGNRQMGRLQGVFYTPPVNRRQPRQRVPPSQDQPDPEEQPPDEMPNPYTSPQPRSCMNCVMNNRPCDDNSRPCQNCKNYGEEYLCENPEGCANCRVQGIPCADFARPCLNCIMITQEDLCENPEPDRLYSATPHPRAPTPLPSPGCTNCKYLGLPCFDVIRPCKYCFETKQEHLCENPVQDQLYSADPPAALPQTEGRTYMPDSSEEVVNYLPCQQCQRKQRSCDKGPRPCLKCVATHEEQWCEHATGPPDGRLVIPDPHQYRQRDYDQYPAEGGFGGGGRPRRDNPQSGFMGATTSPPRQETPMGFLPSDPSDPASFPGSDLSEFSDISSARLLDQDAFSAAIAPFVNKPVTAGLFTTASTSPSSYAIEDSPSSAWDFLGSWASVTDTETAIDDVLAARSPGHEGNINLVGPRGPASLLAAPTSQPNPYSSIAPNIDPALFALQQNPQHIPLHSQWQEQANVTQSLQQRPGLLQYDTFQGDPNIFNTAGGDSYYGDLFGDVMDVDMDLSVPTSLIPPAASNPTLPAQPVWKLTSKQGYNTAINRGDKICTENANFWLLHPEKGPTCNTPGAWTCDELFDDTNHSCAGCHNVQKLRAPFDEHALIDISKLGYCDNCKRDLDAARLAGSVPNLRLRQCYCVDGLQNTWICNNHRKSKRVDFQRELIRKRLSWYQRGLKGKCGNCEVRDAMPSVQAWKCLACEIHVAMP